MKRDMNDKTEIVTLAAFFVFVLFSAMIDPIFSAVIAIGVLSGIGIWKVSNK
jgi:integral membrane sensor domain MASE1